MHTSKGFCTEAHSRDLGFISIAFNAPSGTVVYNDLYSFSPNTSVWSALSPSGPLPAPRFGMGFAATPSGMLYMFGGANGSGG